MQVPGIPQSFKAVEIGCALVGGLFKVVSKLSAWFLKKNEVFL